MPDDIVIIGAGGAAISTVDVAERTGRTVRCLVDENGLVAPGALWHGIPMVGSLDEAFALGSISNDLAQIEVAIGVGNGANRLRIARRLSTSRPMLRYATLVSPAAIVSPRARVAAGCLVGGTTLVGGDCVVGEHAFLLDVTLGHGDALGVGVTLAPGVRLAGDVTLGDRTTVGMNATVREGVKVGADVIIGANTFVSRDVPDGAVVVGVPGRILRMRDDLLDAYPNATAPGGLAAPGRTPRRG